MRFRNFIIFGFLLVFTTSCADLIDSIKAAEEEPVVGAKEKGCALGGAAVKGIIDAATVTVYAVNATGTDGELLATTKTDNTGSWSATPPTCSPDGVYRVKVDEGTYTSEATQATVTNSVQYTAIVDLNSANISGSAESLSITPIATFIDAQASASLAASLKATNGTGDRFAASTALSTAIYNANQKVKAQFGLTTNPLLIKVNLDNPDETESNREGTKLGLILGALTQQAADLGLADPGNLIVALAADIADGTFDGTDAANQPVQIVEAGTVGTVALATDAGTTGLAAAIDTYIVSPTSTFARGGLLPDDVVTIVEEIDVCVLEPASCFVEEIVVESTCGFNVAKIEDTETDISGVITYQSYETYTYDSSGHMVSMAFWDASAVTGVFVQNGADDIVTTDSMGRVTSIVNSAVDDNDWLATYSSDGKLLTLGYTNYTDTTKTLRTSSSLQTYTYDANGKLTSKVSDNVNFDANDVQTTSSTYTTSYVLDGTTGRRLSASSTQWDSTSETTTPSSTMTYEYNVAGDLIRETKSDAGGYGYTVDYIYSLDGMIASALEKSFYSTAGTVDFATALPTNITKNTYTYNSDRSMSREVRASDWDADGVVDSKDTQVYTYDSTQLSSCNPDYKGGGNFFWHYSGVIGSHEMYAYPGNGKPSQ